MNLRKIGLAGHESCIAQTAQLVRAPDHSRHRPSSFRLSHFSSYHASEIRAGGGQGEWGWGASIRAASPRKVSQGLVGLVARAG